MKMNKATIENRSARFDYNIEDTLECGMVLKGHDVKSISNGMASIKESWVAVENGELILKQAHITVWDTADAHRTKSDTEEVKLLAHKKEIKWLERKVQREGYTIVPLKIYSTKKKYKILIGIGKGKKLYDKRAYKKEQDLDREAQRTLKNGC